MMMGYGLLVWLLVGGVMIAVVAGIVGLAAQRGASSPGTWEPSGNGSRQALDERLARGEIGPKEYKALREQIEQ